MSKSKWTEEGCGNVGSVEREGGEEWEGYCVLPLDPIKSVVKSVQNR